MAIRPRTLPASIAPVAVGTALAVHDTAFHAASAAIALVLAVVLQILANIANDYFDHKRGVDSPDRLGPTRVASAGLISLRAMQVAIAIFCLIAVGLGGYAVIRVGALAAVIGFLALVAAIAYSAGPAPLSAVGLGDAAAFLFFGPVAVCGTYFLQARAITGASVVASVSVGALVAAVLVVNNYRDINTDKAAGKITLAVRIGAAGSRVEYAFLYGIAYAATVVLGMMLATPWVALTACSAPLAFLVLRDMFGAVSGTALNQTLARTASFALVHSLLLAAGIVIDVFTAG